MQSLIQKLHKSRTLMQNVLVLRLEPLPRYNFIQDNEANTELIDFISKTLSVKRSLVSLNRGSKGRNKLLNINNSTLSIEKVLELLKP